MDKSNLDKLIRLYREGYISRDELIAHSKKAILKKDKSTRKVQRPQPATKRPPVSAPIQAIIDLDTPPQMPDKIAVPASGGITLWNGYSRGNPILASMLGGALIAMTILAVLILVFDSEPEQKLANLPTTTSENTATKPAAATTTKSSANKSLENTSAAKNSKTSNHLPKNNQTIAQLQSIATQFEQTSHWTAKKISRFQQLWQNLATEQKDALKDTHWFKTFSLIVAIQLSQIHSLSAENPDNASFKQELQTLRGLSIALGNPATAFEDPVIKTRRTISISDIELKPTPPQKPVSTPTTSKKVSKPAPSTQPTASANIARLPQLEKLLSQYVGYYESGNLDNIVKLFNGSGWHQGQIGDYELREGFKDTFNKTLQRKMLVENINWSFKGDTALATGKLTLSYTDRENQEKHEQHGSIRLVATLHDNEYRFSNLYHIFQ